MLSTDWINQQPCKEWRGRDSDATNDTLVNRTPSTAALTHHRALSQPDTCHVYLWICDAFHTKVSRLNVGMRENFKHQKHYHEYFTQPWWKRLRNNSQACSGFLCRWMYTAARRLLLLLSSSWGWGWGGRVEQTRVGDSAGPMGSDVQEGWLRADSWLNRCGPLRLSAAVVFFTSCWE